MYNIEPITNEKFLSDIKKGINDYGVFLIAVTSHKLPDEAVAGFIYTIGHQERQRPDMMIITKSDDLDTVPPESAQLRLRAASNLLNSLVKHWDESPVRVGDTAQDSLGVLYKVARDSDNAFKPLAIQASNYYGQSDYPLLVLLPAGFVH